MGERDHDQESSSSAYDNVSEKVKVAMKNFAAHHRLDLAGVTPAHVQADGGHQRWYFKQSERQEPISLPKPETETMDTPTAVASWWSDVLRQTGFAGKWRRKANESRRQANSQATD